MNTECVWVFKVLDYWYPSNEKFIKKNNILIYAAGRFMDKKIELTLMATSFAIFFAILIEVWSKYSKLLLSIEVIVLPVVYYVGYEILMKKQKKDFDELLTAVQNRGNALEAKNIQLKAE